MDEMNKKTPAMDALLEEVRGAYEETFGHPLVVDLVSTTISASSWRGSVGNFEAYRLRCGTEEAFIVPHHKIVYYRLQEHNPGIAVILRPTREESEVFGKDFGGNSYFSRFATAKRFVSALKKTAEAPVDVIAQDKKGREIKVGYWVYMQSALYVVTSVTPGRLRTKPKEAKITLRCYYMDSGKFESFLDGRDRIAAGRNVFCMPFNKRLEEHVNSQGSQLPLLAASPDLDTQLMARRALGDG